MAKKRLDQLLVDRGLAATKSKAQALIMSGRVFSKGVKMDKSGASLAEDVELALKDDDIPYVSRGGIKLEHALIHFKVDPNGKRAVDIGASTGGFTDCLLKHGAASVTSIDVGTGQLDWTLRNDPRVRVMEKFNARDITPENAGGPFDIAVIDVSFISLKLVLPQAISVTKPGGVILSLVKPQFEAGRQEVSKGRGVIRNEEIHREVVREISEFGTASGLDLIGEVESPIKGPKGNREFFLAFSRG